MITEELTLNRLRRNFESSDFQNSYTSLMLNETQRLNNDKLKHLLKIAIIFLNYGEYNLTKLGYRIILRYSNLYSDFQPLYDVTINKGYIPVSKFIEDKHFGSTHQDNFFRAFFSAYKENFKESDKFYSLGQKNIVRYSRESNENFVIIAPTSYGKSEIIISKIINHRESKICIIVPSKALLAQTKKRLLENEVIATTIRRIITHPDMYKGTEGNFVAVLTQERLLRLLQRNPSFSLDLLLVDEAHNLLKGDSRAILLAQVLMIVKKRNPSTILNFFTPFISNHDNLKIPYSQYGLSSQSTNEYIKVEQFFYCDLTGDKKLYFYDQFVDKSFDCNNSIEQDEISVINKYKADKNIVYLNKPRDIEKLALSLRTDTRSSENIDFDELLSSIADFVHPEYNLLKCIRNGVVYHHGGMPDIVRLYVENIFSKLHFLKFIVTSSTLLEGVNIPAKKIFLLTTKIGRSNLSKSEFKNIIGRICRFSEVFNLENGDLGMLEPEIYLIKGGYEARNANHPSFLKQRAKVDISFEDNVQNVLLKEDEGTLNQADRTKIFESLEYLENIEPQTVSIEGVEYVESLIAKLCFKNNVYDFDIKENEEILLQNLESWNSAEITNESEVLDAIYNIFLLNVDISEVNLKRLENEAARNFYSMILSYRTNGSTYKQMIARFVNYWKGVDNKIVYVGPRWGEIVRDEENRTPTYVDLSTKSDNELTNLAIIKIKEEQDFLDNSLLKYVEILKELDLLNLELYDRIKYGSSNQSVISLLKNGFSIELAHVITKAIYRDYISIDTETDEVHIREDIVGAMEAAQENKILIFELSYHLN